VPYRDHTSKALRYGTRSQGISEFYLHTPRSSANGMNHTCLCLPSRNWYLFIDPGRMEGWVGLTSKIINRIYKNTVNHKKLSKLSAGEIPGKLSGVRIIRGWNIRIPIIPCRITSLYSSSCDLCQPG